jgi:hypothetical protein
MTRCEVRYQKGSRYEWASCSGKGTVSLEVDGIHRMVCVAHGPEVRRVIAAGHGQDLQWDRPELRLFDPGPPARRPRRRVTA